jgi:hypothetical protein
MKKNEKISRDSWMNRQIALIDNESDIDTHIQNQIPLRTLIFSLI